MPYSRDYEAKYRTFRSHLPRPKPQVGPQVELHIQRKDVMESSFRAIMTIKDPEILKARYISRRKVGVCFSMKYLTFFSRLWVVFDGERGLDYGGLSREWFLILSREMFNPYYGLFEYSAM